MFRALECARRASARGVWGLLGHSLGTSGLQPLVHHRHHRHRHKMLPMGRRSAERVHCRREMWVGWSMSHAKRLDEDLLLRMLSPVAACGVMLFRKMCRSSCTLMQAVVCTNGAERGRVCTHHQGADKANNDADGAPGCVWRCEDDRNELHCNSTQNDAGGQVLQS